MSAPDIAFIVSDESSVNASPTISLYGDGMNTMYDRERCGALSVVRTEDIQLQKIVINDAVGVDVIPTLATKLTDN
eukprot:2740077-Pleurochrysis_carterae.AAC.1